MVALVTMRDSICLSLKDTVLHLSTCKAMLSVGKQAKQWNDVTVEKSTQRLARWTEDARSWGRDLVPLSLAALNQDDPN
jgi:hypothetical protein